MRIIYSIALVVTSLIDINSGSSSPHLSAGTFNAADSPPSSAASFRGGHNVYDEEQNQERREERAKLYALKRLREAEGEPVEDQTLFKELKDMTGLGFWKRWDAIAHAFSILEWEKIAEKAKLYALKRLREAEGEPVEDQTLFKEIKDQYSKLNDKQAFHAIADAHSILDLERVMAEKASLHDEQERLILKAKDMIGEILATLAGAIESPDLSAEHIFGLALARTIHPVTPDPARVEEVTQKAIAMIEAGVTGDEDVLKMISTEIQNPKYVSGILADAKRHVSYLLAEHREEARIQEDKIKTAKLLIDERFAEFEIIDQLKKQFPGCNEFEASHILSLANASNFKSLISNRERLVDEARSRLKSDKQMWRVKGALQILTLKMKDPTLNDVPLDDIIREAKESSH